MGQNHRDQQEIPGIGILDIRDPHPFVTRHIELLTAFIPPRTLGSLQKLSLLNLFTDLPSDPPVKAKKVQVLLTVSYPFVVPKAKVMRGHCGRYPLSQSFEFDQKYGGDPSCKKPMKYLYPPQDLEMDALFTLNRIVMQGEFSGTIIFHEEVTPVVDPADDIHHFVIYVGEQEFINIYLDYLAKTGNRNPQYIYDGNELLAKCTDQQRQNEHFDTKTVFVRLVR